MIAVGIRILHWATLSAAAFIGLSAPVTATPDTHNTRTHTASAERVIADPRLMDVHRIKTVMRYLDGVVEVRHGTGFVLGRRFITVYHNIDAARTHAPFERRIEINGVVVRPSIIDSLNDIAIFDLPAELCVRWCQDSFAAQRSAEPSPAAVSTRLARQQQISWLGGNGRGEELWQQAGVVDVVFKNYQASPERSACDSDVVVAVDKPFFPGSSGGPVWDLLSGKVIGVIQGSFVRESGVQVGYYKPLSCVMSLFTGVAEPRAAELATLTSLEDTTL